MDGVAGSQLVGRRQSCTSFSPEPEKRARTHVRRQRQRIRILTYPPTPLPHFTLRGFTIIAGGVRFCLGYCCPKNHLDTPRRLP